MPNGLGAILAALAGGAEGYTNLKQREREEALEAERRAREEQDRQEQKAFQQFEMERELRKMGGRYTDEMGPGTLNPDAPSSVRTDRVEAALPGTETTVGGRVLPPLKVGVTPMKAALGIEPDKERVRMASQAIEVPGSGGKSGITRRVYLPTADELGDRKFQRETKERGVLEDEDTTKRKTLATEAELYTQQKRDRDIANLMAGGMTRNEATAIIDGGARYGDLKETPSVLAANRRALALERREEGRFLTKNVTDARANYTRLLASGLGSDADKDDARAAVAEAVESLNEWRAGGNKTPVVAEGGAGAGGGRRLPRPDDPDDRLTDEQVAFAQQNPGIAKPGLTARANAALIDAAMRKQATPVKLPTPVKPPTSAGEVVKRFMQGDSAVGSEEDVLPADTGAAVRRGVGESLGTYIDRTEGKTSGTEGKTPLTTSRTAGMTLPDSVGTLPGGSSSWDRIVPLGSGGRRSWADDPKLAAKLAAYLASLSEVELEALGMRPGETFENFKKRYPTIGPRSMLRFPRELDPGVVRPKR